MCGGRKVTKWSPSTDGVCLAFIISGVCTVSVWVLAVSGWVQWVQFKTVFVVMNSNNIFGYILTAGNFRGNRTWKTLHAETVKRTLVWLKTNMHAHRHLHIFLEISESHNFSVSDHLQSACLLLPSATAGRQTASARWQTGTSFSFSAAACSQTFHLPLSPGCLPACDCVSSENGPFL